MKKLGTLVSGLMAAGMLALVMVPALPAVPVHGQNANLYGDEWSQTLDNNVRVLRQ